MRKWISQLGALGILALSAGTARAQMQACNTSSTCDGASQFGNGIAIYANSTGTGDALRISKSGTSGYGINVYQDAGWGAGMIVNTGSGSIGNGVTVDRWGSDNPPAQAGVYAQTIYGTGVKGYSYYGNGVVGHSESITGGTAGVKGEAVSGGTAIWGQNTGGASAVAAWFDGLVYSNGTAMTSDARLKKEVQDLSYGLREILRMRPVSFKWKNDDEHGFVHLGVIAQEMEKVVPEVVSRPHSPSGDEVLTVNYSELVPILVKAVREQNEIITRQDARIAALEKGRSPLKVSSLLHDVGGPGALFGLLPLGAVLAYQRRKTRAGNGTASS
jgi:hypothetical protein